MTDTEAMVDRLAQHQALHDVPRVELEWLAAHGQLRRFEPGEYVARTGDPRDTAHLYIVLSGRLSVYVQRDRVQRKIRGGGAGEFMGLLPFSRMTHSTADLVVDETMEVLRIDSSLFPELVRECPATTAAAVHSMVDRVQVLTESNLHDEKMFSLGKLAAGLAHELNNPASAALRGVAALAQLHREIEAASQRVANAELSPTQREMLREIVDKSLAAPRPDDSPIARAEREDAIADWLQARGVDITSAAALGDAFVSIERLDALAAAIPSSALGPGIEWMAATLGASALLGEIGQSVTRIHSLIGAVKGFTQMDRPLIQNEPTAIAPGVRDTLAVMESKARARSVAIDVDVPTDLPLVHGSAAELNQVWASLLDNALDAAPASTRVAISARTAGERVVVSVLDRGVGVPADIRGRVFDPFFTTKPIGEGRGLGLNTAMRIVTLLGGQIELDSAPGHTEFRVTLPIVLSQAQVRDGPQIGRANPPASS